MSKSLYVRHSGRTLDLSAIEDLFTTVGDVENSRMEDKAGILVMSTEKQAFDCAERFNGHVIDGFALSVKMKANG